MRSPDGMPVPPERLLASRALDTGETVLGAELLVEKADGSSVPVLGGSAPIRDGDGRVIGGVVVLQDMTQLKEVEAALRRAVRARDEVLGIVAHDLRSPLGAVLLQAQVLQAQRGILPERAGKAVDRIERQAKRMDRLIQDLLDVIRIDAGALSMEHGRIAVQELLGEVLETQGQIAAADSIRLRLDLNDRPPDVWGDRDRLMQVFENLIANAIKFTGPGGSITVGARPAEGSTLFWVADDGPGVSAELLPHLFDPFWQASRRDRRGAGLGLQISKGIVEAQGGRIWVESEPGRGATFYFTVPAEGAAP